MSLLSAAMSPSRSFGLSRHSEDDMPSRRAYGQFVGLQQYSRYWDLSQSLGVVK